MLLLSIMLCTVAREFHFVDVTKELQFSLYCLLKFTFAFFVDSRNSDGSDVPFCFYLDETVHVMSEPCKLIATWLFSVT